MKKTISHSVIIVIVALVMCTLCGNTGQIFGSTVDWFCQHTAFADYFRTLFYDTHQLFPNLAMGLGGGENIYYFSYYGLFSPIVLLSYCFPMIKMADYMMVMSILLVISGGILLYFWLKSRSIPPYIALLTALLYVVAGPVIFHSHRHLMFVNYLPFLILALWGVDRYFDQHRSGLLCLANFLVVLCSFYYSIGGMIVLVLYGIYRYFHSEKEKSAASFFKTGFHFICPIVVSVLLAGVLLIPTFMALLDGRSAGGGSISFLKLFLPIVSTRTVVGSAYAIGLSVTAIISLFYFLFRGKREMRILSIGMILVFCVPIFSYILNGGLYLRDKVFIPFLPLLCFMMAHMFYDILGQPLNKKKVFQLMASVGLTAVVVLLGKVPKSMMPMILIELAVFSLSFLLYHLCKKPIVCALPIFLCSAGICYVYNTRENYVEKPLYQKVTGTENSKLVSQALSLETNVCRTANLFEIRDTMNRVYSPEQYLTSTYSSSYHQNYRKFADAIMQNERPKRNKLMNAASFNPFFLRLMGVKYVVGTSAPVGYQKIAMQNGLSVYKNNDVLPLGYVTDRMMSTEQLQKLTYPYQGEYLQNYVAVKNGPIVNLTSQMQPLPFEFPLKSDRNIRITKTQDGYDIQAKKETKVSLQTDGLEFNDILLVAMDVSPDKKNHKDITIKINDVENTRTESKALYANHNNTFHFAVSDSEGLSQIDVTFGKGNYHISSMKAWRIAKDAIGQNAHNLGTWYLQKEKTKGDKLVGDIDVTQDGMFVSSIPYSDGFTVLVDQKKVDIQQVNTAFIGFPITKGSHNIQFIYRAPGQKAGLVLSGTGILLLMAMFWLEKRENKKGTQC